MRTRLRIARPVTDIERSTDMYCRGLGLRVLGRFEDHEGFDGVMLGTPGADYQFELTLAAGFKEVAPFNPYWAVRGRTYEDADGYRVVVERSAWVEDFAE